MKKVDINIIYKILKKETKQYNSPYVQLQNVRQKNVFRTLISTMLSARTRDEITSKVSENLFFKVKNFRDLKKISKKELEHIIKPVNYYKNKAKHLKQMVGVIEKEFNGKIPSDVDALMKLPGVGRKTANLVSSTVFKNKNALYVDTHVHRITNRWGYVKTKTPEKTEQALRKKLPKKYWRGISDMLVVFGQNICKPRIPLCSKCKIIKYCNRIGVIKSK